MFEPLSKEYIENTIRQPIKAKNVFKQFLDHNLVFEDYLLAIKSNPVLRDGKQYNDIEDIVRVYPLIDWVIIIDWISNEIGTHPSLPKNDTSLSEKHNRVSVWQKLNTAWADTVRNLQEIKSV